jgi:uncharacterized protein DUF5670
MTLPLTVEDRIFQMRRLAMSRIAQIRTTCAQTHRRTPAIAADSPCVEFADRSLYLCHERWLARERRITVLYRIAVTLLIAWLLGLVGTFTVGPILHLLLIVAIVLFVIELLSGSRTLA